MSKVSIESKKAFEGEEKAVLEEFKKHLDDLIEKNKTNIEAFLAPSFVLIHKDGKSQPREGFIQDVIGGALNYFKARIIDPSIEIENNVATMKVDVEFDCLVYGNKGVFTLNCVNKFEKINNNWLFIIWNTNN